MKSYLLQSVVCKREYKNLLEIGGQTAENRTNQMQIYSKISFHVFFFFFLQVIGLTWGILLKSVFDIGPIDYIIASDCFYDPTVFEDILVTVSFLLNTATCDTSPVKFLFTYQNRSSDWSIDHLLQKWHLKCSKVSLACVRKYCPIEFDKLTNGHTIYLLEITKLP